MRGGDGHCACTENCSPLLGICRLLDFLETILVELWGCWGEFLNELFLYIIGAYLETELARK